MLTIPKNQGRGKEVLEPRPLQRLRRRKIPLITKPLCQPQNQGQKSNQRSKKPLQRKKNMSTLYSSVMSVSSICFCYVFWPRVLNLAVITERMENEIKKKEFYENYTSLIDFFCRIYDKKELCYNNFYVQDDLTNGICGHEFLKIMLFENWYSSKIKPNYFKKQCSSSSFLLT